MTCNSDQQRSGRAAVASGTIREGVKRCGGGPSLLRATCSPTSLEYATQAQTADPFRAVWTARIDALGRSNMRARPRAHPGLLTKPHQIETASCSIFPF